MHKFKDLLKYGIMKISDSFIGFPVPQDTFPEYWIKLS